MAYSPGGSGIVRLTADYKVRADGVLEVVETIDYAYERNGHRLDRALQVRRPADTGNLLTGSAQRGRDRVWKITGITATDATGAAVAVDVSERDPLLPPYTGGSVDGWDSRLADLRVKIGPDLPSVDASPGVAERPRSTTFVLRYQVRGALERVGHDYELNWPDRHRVASGDESDELDAPTPEIRLEVPGELVTAGCAGYYAVAENFRRTRPTSPCSTTQDAPRQARFSSQRKNSTVTVTARIPRSSVEDGGALYDDPPVPRSAWITRALAGAAVLAGMWGVIAGTQRRQRSRRLIS
ncbi:DUF2207 domain-containing protein [Kribbella italica]|uniref:DUF2207 domain-containing protein n=1 Tax=Kribbella italica TaxID=1540520 RepID=A0A7W9MTY3_9ACTN|nr:DUF2207 domain-containing protein [Kribbella italica]MBB5835620.1 hypothetical protein [Kribbella italica]